MAIPFLFELRAIMDWMWTQTSMSLFDWLKMEDIFANTFQLKVIHTSPTSLTFSCISLIQSLISRYLHHISFSVSEKQKLIIHLNGEREDQDPPSMDWEGHAYLELLPSSGFLWSYLHLETLLVCQILHMMSLWKSVLMHISHFSRCQLNMAH